MRLRRSLLGSSAAVALLAGASSAATQFCAARLSYHAALGSPWFGHVYPPWKWIEWMQAPWAPNAKATFVWVYGGFLFLFGTAALAAMAIAGRKRRRPVRHEGVHGTARFQTEEEIARGGLLGGTGVYVGGWTDKKGRIRYLRHDGPEHAIVIAPTRSGKGVGPVLMTLLSWSASALVYDEKGELWQLSAGWRSQGGGNVCVRWEPGAVSGSAGFNFLAEIRLGSPYEVGDAQAIALAICDPKGEGLEVRDHWAKSAWALIADTILHVCYTAAARGGTGCLPDIAAILSDPDRDANELWEEMRSNRHLPGGQPHPVIAAAGRDMIDRPERERGSVLSSAKVYLTIFTDPIVARNSRRSDFRLLDLMNHSKPVSLYVITRGTDRERLRPLVRLFLTIALRRLMGEELRYKDGRASMPHRHQLLPMLDEFPSLGRMEIIENSLSKAAGWGIKFFLAAQNREQLFQAYGRYQNITANCHLRMVFAPNEWDTARWISDMIGNSTIIKEDLTESGTRWGSLTNVSRTFHEVSRPLMTPDEIMALRKPQKDDAGNITESGEMVIFEAGQRPILGTQLLYFRDPIFNARARVPPPRTSGTIGGAAGRFTV